MSDSLFRCQVPSAVTRVVLAAVILTGLTIWAVVLLRSDRIAEPAPPPAEAILPAGSYPISPLAAGETFPTMEVGGWVNDPPRASADGFMVVDLWADWCPVCRQVAPGLVTLQQKFAARGVRFVSLTTLGPEEVKGFADEFKIPWPCGYGVPQAWVAGVGAYSTDRMSAAYHPRLPNYHPGHELTPTMYLISPDGRVVWNDQQARPRHLKDASGVLEELAAEIRSAIGDGQAD